MGLGSLPVSQQLDQFWAGGDDGRGTADPRVHFGLEVACRHPGGGVHYPRGSAATGVQRQLLLPLVLPHLRMLPAILRMIVPAVSDESRAGGTHGREPAARRFTLDRKHAAARGVLRSRVRQSAASRESSWTARTPPSKPDRKAHNCYRSRRAGGVSPVEAALPPVGHLHDAPPTAPVHPTATCRVVARADRCSRCSPVRYVTV